METAGTGLGAGTAGLGGGAGGGGGRGPRRLPARGLQGRATGGGGCLGPKLQLVVKKEKGLRGFLQLRTQKKEK